MKTVGPAFGSIFCFYKSFPFFLDWESLEAQMNINANQFILFYTALYCSDYLLDF